MPVGMILKARRECLGVHLVVSARCLHFKARSIQDFDDLLDM